MFQISSVMCHGVDLYLTSSFPFVLLFSGTKGIHAKQNHVKKARLRASVTERRIRDLSLNMRMKEELIKELDKTGAFCMISLLSACVFLFLLVL